MTRAQYIALCIIGGVAVAAWLESYKVGQFVAKLADANGIGIKAGQYTA